MARNFGSGKPRGSRGTGRGKGANSGLGIPGAQNTRTSAAQSGGRSTSFQGGKGGGAFGNKSGGAIGSKSIGRQVLSNRTTATIRSPGGDNTVVPGGLSGARVGPNVATQQGTNRDQKILPHLRRGAGKGKGGSNQ